MTARPESPPAARPGIPAMLAALQVMEHAAKLWNSPRYRHVTLPGLGATTCGEIAAAMAGTIAAVELLLDHAEIMAEIIAGDARPATADRLAASVATMLRDTPCDAVLGPAEPPLPDIPPAVPPDSPWQPEDNLPGADGADMFNHPLRGEDALYRFHERG